MITEKNLRIFKGMVFGLMALHILFFLTGLFELGPKQSTAILIPYIALYLALVGMTLKSKVKGILKVYLSVTVISSIVFTLGAIYGILGNFEFYALNSSFYYIVIIGASMGFAFGAIGSMLLFENE